MIYVPQTSIDPGSGRGFQVQDPEQIRSFAPAQGAALGRAIQEGGTALQRTAGVLDDIQDKQDAAAAQAADNFFSEKLRGRMLQHTSLRGKAAVDDHEAVLADVQRLREEAASSLGTPEQRLLFEQSSEPTMRNARDRAGMHYVRENTAHYVGELDAAIALRQQEYADNTDNPAAMAEARGFYLGQIDARSEALGFGEKQAEQARREGLVALHAGALDGYVGNEDEEGLRNYLNDYGTEIPVAMRGQAKASLTAITTANTAARMLPEIQRTKPLIGDQVEHIGGMLQRREIGVRVHDELVNRAISADNRARAAADTRANELLHRAQVRVQLGEPISFTDLLALDDAGVGEDFDLFVQQGGKAVTTPYGHEMLWTAMADPRRFLNIPDAEAAYRIGRPLLDDSDLPRWMSGWAAAHASSTPSAATSRAKVQRGVEDDGTGWTKYLSDKAVQNVAADTYLAYIYRTSVHQEDVDEEYGFTADGGMSFKFDPKAQERFERFKIEMRQAANRRKWDINDLDDDQWKVLSDEVLTRRTTEGRPLSLLTGDEWGAAFVKDPVTGEDVRLASISPTAEGTTAGAPTLVQGRRDAEAMRSGRALAGQMLLRGTLNPLTVHSDVMFGLNRALDPRTNPMPAIGDVIDASLAAMRKDKADVEQAAVTARVREDFLRTLTRTVASNGFVYGEEAQGAFIESQLKLHEAELRRLGLTTDEVRTQLRAQVRSWEMQPEPRAPTNTDAPSFLDKLRRSLLTGTTPHMR